MKQRLGWEDDALRDENGCCPEGSMSSRARCNSVGADIRRARPLQQTLIATSYYPKYVVPVRVGNVLRPRFRFRICLVQLAQPARVTTFEPNLGLCKLIT